MRGVGYLYRDKCKNDEDFFYFVSKEEIEDKYFFSYKDNNNHIWCFDIRSFNKLIANDKRNPYTRELIDNNVINKSNNFIIVMFQFYFCVFPFVKCFLFYIWSLPIVNKYR